MAKKKRRLSASVRWGLFGATTMFLCVGCFTAYLFLVGSSINPARTEKIQITLENLIPSEEEILIPTFEPLPEFTNSERTTILLMGMDKRPGETYLSRTDTMILFSIDPISNTASMLSIPRDLYVEIPGYRRYRINTAFVLGAQEGGELGGIQLAQETIQANLGVQVDHYVILDFQTVIDLIDAFGGVTVDVPKDIDDPYYPDMNYGYDPLFIPAGVQTLEGELALKYMRTRHADNDIARSSRQQQVISSFRQQIADQGTTGLMLKSRQLYREFQEGIYSDLAMDDMLGIFNYVNELPEGNLRQAVMDDQYVYDHITESGGYVFLMKTDAVIQLIQDLFG